MSQRQPENTKSPSEPATVTAPPAVKNEPTTKDANNERETPIVGIRKEDLDAVPEVSSPAPAPTKGGEDDVFTVSHIGRIEIKDNKPTKTPEPSPPPSVPEPRRSRSKTRAQRKPEKHDDDSDQSTSPMDVIDKSPYESEFNAEKGVKLFQEMKELLVEDDGDDFRSVSAEATKIFGPTNAWCLVKANSTLRNRN